MINQGDTAGAGAGGNRGGELGGWLGGWFCLVGEGRARRCARSPWGPKRLRNSPGRRRGRTSAAPGCRTRRPRRRQDEVVLAEHHPEPAVEHVEPLVALVRLRVGSPAGAPAGRPSCTPGPHPAGGSTARSSCRAGDRPEVDARVAGGRPPTRSSSGTPVDAGQGSRSSRVGLRVPDSSRDSVLTEMPVARESSARVAPAPTQRPQVGPDGGQHLVRGGGPQGRPGSPAAGPDPSPRSGSCSRSGPCSRWARAHTRPGPRAVRPVLVAYPGRAVQVGYSGRAGLGLGVPVVVGHRAILPFRQRCWQLGDSGGRSGASAGRTARKEAETMTYPVVHDVVVVGGGAAGLSGALALGRFAATWWWSTAVPPATPRPTTCTTS